MLGFGIGRRIARRFPRITATLAGCLFATAILVALESVASHIHRSTEHAIVVGTRALKVEDPLMGYVLRPNQSRVCTSTCDSKVMATKRYTIDGFGRRATPVSRPGKRDQFIVFLGCSFTFGEGCADNETLPYYVGEMAPRYVPYNYGVGGYGPQQALVRLRSNTMRSEVKEPTGIGVYVYLGAHLDRAIGGMACISGWGGKFPYFYLDGGQLKYGGSFDEGRPWTSGLYHWVSKSQIMRVLNVSLPLWHTRTHYDTVAAIIREQRDRFIEQFPGSRFCVLIYNPGLVHPGWLISRLSDSGIDTYEAAEVLGPVSEARGGLLKYPDGHPIPESHKIVAEFFVKRLGIRD